jgi:hypothetical protein
MRALRLLVSVLLGIVILFDVSLAYRFLHYGWPHTLVITETTQGVEVQSFPMRMDVWSWVGFGLYGVLNVVLCYGVWKTWRSTARRKVATK